ncbi:MAG: AbrB/MazE/SpoVT family DNA-binding domain-containing protein [Acidobacteria bacterium]|nr:AbrB/MazE/SpoVT family DNA-binding domain-containing protein [Acidobacteriota bacterium]
MAATIDKAGRVVIPKAVREAAGFEPGMEIEIRLRDGVVEIEPKFAEPRLEYRNGLLVAVADDAGPVPPNEVDEVIEKIRSEGLGYSGLPDADRS